MEIGTCVKEESSTLFMLKNMQCPKGYFLIRRTKREDLLMAKYLSSLRISNPENVYSTAVVEYRGVQYGAKANINVWSPNVTEVQLSTATVWITKGVAPQVDGYQKTGCFNMLCPGFIQVSTKIPLGLVLRPTSTYNGPQYQISIIISQDNATGNWLLAFNNMDIGYWPKSLLPNLSDGASYTA
ncbi:hypothetical protein REPUB_Repub08aG0180300 [Reevesia pubescens]